MGLASVTAPSVVEVAGAWVSWVAAVSGGTVSPSVVSKVLPLPVKQSVEPLPGREEREGHPSPQQGGCLLYNDIINRPVQRGLFYKQPHNSLINKLSHPFPQNTVFTNRKSQRADILRECSPPTMCHMSRDMCHVPHVQCCMIYLFYSFFFFGQSGGASLWEVCYQQGLPCLVSE